MRVLQRLPPFLPYGVAIASTAVALLLSLWLQDIISRSVIGTFFYIAIVISTWYGGRRPGIVAIALSASAINYYFMPPISQIYISDWQDVFRLALFVSVALIINTLTANLQESKRKLEILNCRLAEESASRLRVALKAAQMGMWDWNLVTGEITWSPEHEQLLGLSPGSFDGRYETFEACVYPDDQEGLNQAVTDSLQNRVPYYHEYRVVWADGSIHWVEGRGQTLYGEDGQPVRISGTILSIDQRKQAELDLQAREARFQRLASNIAGMLYQYMLHPDGSDRFTYASAKCRDIYELEPDELLQDSGQSWDMIHPDDVQRVRQQKLNSAEHLDRFDTEFRLLPPSGVVRWVRAVSQPERLSNGDIIWDGLILDITDRKRAEQELRESKERYRTLVENFPNGAVLLFDHDLRYMLAAGQALTETELNLTNLEGKTIWEAFDPEFCQLLEPHYRTALAGNSHVVEIPFGDRIYSVHFIPVYDDQGQVNLGMVMSQNITLQKQAEQVLKTARDELERQVQERTRELQKLTDQLQRSNQELEQFAYVASHDLQEPLRAVTSFTQLLAQDYQGQLDADADTYIEFIVDGATRMQQLIRDLLAYSRTGRYELHLQPVDCNAILKRVKRDLQVAIAENQAVITADPLPTITADPSQITYLLQNLIGNSLKYRSEAAPSIHISAKNNIEEARDDTIQEVSPQSVAKEWVFSIRDNGIGIEPKYAERIFGIFQRLHTRDEYPGTGLGLAICQKIIERHAGRIWVESQLGQGATFFFTIPIERGTQ